MPAQIRRKDRFGSQKESRNTGKYAAVETDFRKLSKKSEFRIDAGPISDIIGSVEGKEQQKQKLKGAEMYYLVAAKIEKIIDGIKVEIFKVLEVVSTELESLEGMKAYADLGYKGICRRIATVDEFVEFSERGGDELIFDVRCK